MTPFERRLKRAVPNQVTLDWRERFLVGLSVTTEHGRELLEEAPVLEPGNRKTGTSGSLYAAMRVWNLPAIATCPAASPWCRRFCYNADPREDVFPLELWKRNMEWAEKRPDDLAEWLLMEIGRSPRPTGIRIHSSGDFFSARYVAMWNRVIAGSADVDFWAYTRSWAEPTLLGSLDALRKSHKNLQLFASWDRTMPTAPLGWRLSLVLESAADDAHNTSIHGSLSCPEEFRDGPNCASCGFCVQRHSGHVVFTAH